MYAVSATVTGQTTLGVTTTRQVPTFYLDERVQGLISEDHASRVALDVIDPARVLRDRGYEIHVCAVKVSDAATRAA